VLGDRLDGLWGTARNRLDTANCLAAGPKKRVQQIDILSDTIRLAGFFVNARKERRTSGESRIELR
jgi:hypothetical protein